MALAVYKPGQGYWTRVLTACGAGALILSGIYWGWNEMEVIRSDHKLYYQTGMALGVIVFFATLLWWALNHPRVVEFMIATEAEMRKVSWPTWSAVRGSTWLVVCGTFLMAALLFFVDIGFSYLFQKIGILAGG